MHHDFTKFPPLKPRLLEAVDRMLAEDIARLMAVIPQESVIKASSEANGGAIKGGAFEGVQDKVSPFGYLKGEGIDAGAGEPEWIVGKDRYKSDSIFDSLNPIDGKVTGAGMCSIALKSLSLWLRKLKFLFYLSIIAAKSEMVKSKLPNSVLGKVWKLADVDKDGMLDSDEFALAMHLINIKLDGHDIPAELPPHLVPPSKRGRF